MYQSQRNSVNWPNCQIRVIVCWRKTFHLSLKSTSSQVVQMSVTDNSLLNKTSQYKRRLTIFNIFLSVHFWLTKFVYFWECTICWMCVCVIYQTRERVFHQDIQTPRSELKKQGAAECFFLTDFKVFGYLMKHSFEFFYMASQTIYYSWRNSKQ